MLAEINSIPTTRRWGIGVGEEEEKERGSYDWWGRP